MKIIDNEKSNCTTIVKETPKNNYGHFVIISEQICDTLGASDIVTLKFADSLNKDGEEFFQYDPSAKHSEPDIQWLNNNSLVVTIDTVSDIIHRKNSIKNINVIYRIGKVYRGI